MYVSTNSDHSIQQTPAQLYPSSDSESDAHTDAKEVRPRDDLFEMSKPVAFYGQPKQLQQVITFAKVKFLTESDFDDEPARQAAYFASLFRGQALVWLSKELVSKPKLLDDFDKFVALVEAQFGQNDEQRVQEASRKIVSLSQRKSVRAYALEFRQHIDILQWNDAAAKAHFIRGLKLHVREALVASGTEFGSLDELIHKATNIDDELYAAKRGRGYGAAGKEKKFTGKCNSCGQFGHKARQCKRGSHQEW